MGDAFNPRPAADYADVSRRAYLAGYTDAFYGEEFGAHDQGQFGAFSTYRDGWRDGCDDAKAAA